MDARHGLTSESSRLGLELLSHEDALGSEG
jgi:hypothetical protein